MFCCLARRERELTFFRVHFRSSSFSDVDDIKNKFINFLLRACAWIPYRLSENNPSLLLCCDESTSEGKGKVDQINHNQFNSTYI